MDVQKLLEILAFTLVVTLTALGIAPTVRYELRRIRSGGWPVVSATVQKGEVLQKGATNFLYVPYRSVLGYRYEINGQHYWGLFALVAEDSKSADRLQFQAEGQIVSIRYDPGNPKTSFMVNKELLGRKIRQDPLFLDFS